MRQPHTYRDLDKDQLEEVLSNFLIDSWSYSKTASFARNEKDFERTYIYREPFKSSASAVAGNAYHEALQLYFGNIECGKVTTLVDLEKVAFKYIEDVKWHVWKIQKTTPTVEQCQKVAIKKVAFLLKSFMKEKSVYEEDLKEVLFVEKYMDEFVTLNGVDIPLPCHGLSDLIIKTKGDKIVVIDHKSVTKYSSEEEVALTRGKQAITYVKLVEAVTGLQVDEVWFVENKVSKNSDGKPQLNCFKIELNADVRKLYEAMLYEPLRRMIQAVSDPDYIYLINENDNFCDKGVLFEFWAKTMIAEVDDFNVPEAKKELISKRLKKVRDVSIATVNPSVIRKFKENANTFIKYDLASKDMTNSQKIEHVLQTFGVLVQVAHVFNGYSSDTYLLEVSAGTTIKSIFRYKLDLANALNVPSIRIQDNLFVYEGNSYLALESGKKRTENLLWDASLMDGFKIPIGMDNMNQVITWDLDNHSTPHMLISGATGSGKSVSIQSTVEYALEKNIEVIIMDPKFEFESLYQNNSNVSVYSEIEMIERIMGDLVEEMNDRVKSGTEKKTLIVFDEFADAVAASRKGKDLDIYEDVQVGFYAPKKGPFGIPLPAQPKIKRQVVSRDKSLEENLKILLQKGRSCGMRIISATQRASVKVITGDAKVNFPVRICFYVPKEVDSKVVLDEGGAEALTGKGDGLMVSPEFPSPVRFQGFYKEV